MCDLIVDLAAIPQVVFDLLGVSCLSFIAIFLIFLVLFYLVTVCIKSASFIIIVLLKVVILVFLACLLLISQLLLLLTEFIFLEKHLCAELLEVLVRLFQNLHESRVLLGVNQVDVRVDVIILQ